MSNKRAVYALSICGQLTLNLHSLNNEGTEGNQQITRQVTIVDADGQPHTVNAVSGDMLKHIQVEHLTKLAVQANLPVCDPAKKFDPNRVAGVSGFAPKGTKDADVIDKIIKTCAVTEMAGVLLTEGRATARPSVVEWAWMVGLPERNHIENFIHLKRVADAGDEPSGGAANLSQNLFHRPANSGVYAAVVNIEVARIGFNDITRKVPADVQDRDERYKVLLQSLLYTFLEPNGAQRNTQNPHLVGFTGVVAVSHNICPSPTISPLHDGYESQIEGIAATLNELVPSTNQQANIEVNRFENFDEFAKIIRNLIDNTTPYSPA